MQELTLIVPYYRNVHMLKRQIEEWNKYPDNINIILVDDGSPEEAIHIVEEFSTNQKNLQLYRITVDIPWNRGGARNLGSKMAKTEWILHVDIDHVLPYDSAYSIFKEEIAERRWYKFRRMRVGKADGTRLKDKIPDDVEFGEIHPHMDSYLVTKKAYWKAGGYDEDYSGCLGGGSSFIKALSLTLGIPKVLKQTLLHVYTRSEILDASDNTLSRDREEYTLRKAEKEEAGRTKSLNPIRFPWERLL